jgi:hypothetical protein
MDNRNHIIYELRVNGQNYIGVTAKTQATTLKSIQARVSKHWYRSQTEGLNWLLCRALRSIATREQIEVCVHEMVQGKAEAHRRERALIRELQPILNSDRR